MNGKVRKLLHVGCGPANPAKLPAMFRGSEWQEVRLDIDEKVQPDIVASMTDMSAVESDGFDALFSSHNVEHLFRHQVQGALREFYRVVRPGGQVVITLPDLQAAAAYVAEGKLDDPLYQSPAGPVAAVDILYGWTKSIAEGNHYMAHKTGFTARTLAKHLLGAGFCNVQVSRHWLDLWAVGLKLPEGHPQREAKARVVNGRLSGPKGQRLPFWYERMLQIQANPDTRTDELDAAPAIWQPLGLREDA